MTTFLLILMVLSVIAALERTNRRQSPRATGLHGAHAHVDRDWARIELDLMASESARPNHRSGLA